VRSCPHIIAILVAALCAGSPGLAGQDSEPPEVRIGSKKFTESVILGELAAALVEDAGAKAIHRRDLGGTRVLWNALIAGDIDLYAEYTGTLKGELLAEESLQSLDDIRGALAERAIVMGRPLGFNNTYAIGMLRERAQELGIANLSDLGANRELDFGFTNEFMDRSDGWPGMQRRYGLEPASVRGLDHDLAYRGLEAGTIDVTDLYSTDADIVYYDLRLLEDDRGYFPEYQAVWLYRADLRPRAREAVEALERLEGTIDDAAMQSLNASVKLGGLSEARAAANFLEDELGLRVEVRDESSAERLWRNTLAHLQLVAISLAAAIALALPLGILAARRPRLGQVLLGGVGVIQTIPSLALLVFMIPLLGIGAPPAIVALFLYSLLPIVRNTHAGLTGIAPEALEVADALGLPRAARLRRIELPLAAPSILAGIQTAAVINVGTATLGALIGAGGYGQPILTGIRLDDVGLILEGALPAAGLALLVQGGFQLLGRKIVPRGLRLEQE